MSEANGWRARRRARIERVAAGGPLWVRPRPTPAQVRRRRLAAAGFLALLIALALAAQLREGGGPDSGPQTALRPDGEPLGPIVSDDGTADDEFAEGGRGDARRVARQDRERQRLAIEARRDRARAVRAARAAAAGGSVQRRVRTTVPALTAPGTPSQVTSPRVAPPPSARGRSRPAPQRRSATRRSRPVRAPVPIPATPAPPPASPVPTPPTGGGEQGDDDDEDEDDEDDDDD